jgi:PAS domain S-box-containing protein
MDRLEHPLRRRSALRDLLWILLAVVTLLLIGAATDLFEGMLEWYHDEIPGAEDEIVIGLLLLALGLALFAARRWRVERQEFSARIQVETRFRTLVEQLPVVVYQDAVDDLSTALYVSPQYERVFGYRAEERLEDPGFWIHRLHPDDRERVLDESRRTNRTGDPFLVDYRFIAKDGRVLWVRDEAILLRDAQGNPDRWQGILMDITQQKVAEERLAETELRYRRLIESIPAVTYVQGAGPNEGEYYVSPQVEEMLGYTQDEWGPDFDMWYATIHPDDRVRVLEADERSDRTGEPFDAEYRQRRKDGTFAWVHDQAVLIRDEDGRPQYWQGIRFDVTSRREAEGQLRDAEARYRALVEHIPAVLYVDPVDDRAPSIYVSPQVEEVLGVSQAAYLSDPQLWLELVLPEDRERVLHSWREALDERRGWRVEYRIRRPDTAQVVWIRDESALLLDERGEPTLVQGVMSDVTERKLAEQALRESERREREAAERLRALDEMKNTFLAAVSHELRSPLTSILGLALTLERTRLPEDDRADLLRRLAMNARKLDGLLKDLLDIDRLNRGIVTPNYRPTDVGALVRRTVENLELLGDRRILVDAAPVSIAADPAKVERIVENLLANAARHTSPDVHIWVRVWERDDGAVVAVEDDGPGVPADLQREIFEPFRQGPSSSPHSPGTGIGLSLVAMFAELHGGRAWVQDREGGGASFRVFLPREPIDPSAVAEAPAGLGIADAG